MKDKKYDLIIVGTGPAGMSAAVYAARYKLETLLIGDIHGGMAAEAHEIWNLISYKKIRGFELAIKLKEQVENLGVEILTKKVSSIKKNKNFFKIIVENENYYSKKIILATGSEKRKLGVKDEKKFLGKGISYCATCDATFFKDKTISVIGGSDAALTAALLLSDFAIKVYLIYRKNKFFRAEPAWVDAVEKNKKIRTIFNANVVELIGKNFLEKIKINNGTVIESSGLFIEIGSTPNSGLARKLGIELENDFIITDKKQKTNIKGIFAAGDVTNNALKQIITAAAEGAIAATQAYEEIKTEEK